MHGLKTPRNNKLAIMEFSKKLSTHLKKGRVDFTVSKYWIPCSTNRCVFYP